MVTIIGVPAITVNSSTICAGDTALLTASAGTSYLWSTGATTNSVSVSPPASATYTVTGTTSGCSDTAVSIVTVNPLPDVTVNSQGICYGETATLTATGASTYLWSTGSTTGSITDSPLITTTYTVTGFSSSGCSGIAMSTVTVNPVLSVNTTGDSSICTGNTATITATALNGSGGPYTYSWAPGVLNTGSSLVVSPTVSTTYTVTATDGCSTDAIDSVTITVLPKPSVSFNADINSGCAPLCVNFTDLSTIGQGILLSQNWSFGADGTGPQYCFQDAGTYTVTLTVTATNGCIASLTNVNMINVSALPIANFTAPLSTGILAPMVNFEDNSTDAVTWNWDFGDSLSGISDNTSNLQNPSHIYSGIGNYCTQLIVGNTGGCFDTIQKYLDIDSEFSFYIPNSFSPDGDGRNDEFFGKGENIDEFIMQIFDRWGNLIFYTDDINKHWNGKVKNEAEIALLDVYVYIIDIIDNKKKSHKYIGNVTILK